MTTKIPLVIGPYREELRDQVIALWQNCGLVFPGNDAGKDIDLKMAEQPQWLLVGESGDQLLGTVMVGYDGHRGWINYLAVDPSHRGKGLGRALMMHVEKLLLLRGCPKINLQIRSSNSDTRLFYEALGYSIEDRLSLGKRLGD